MSSRRIRSILRQGAASALLVSEPATADPADDAGRLSRWAGRAQQRLGLTPAQQRALQVFIGEQTVKQSLPRQSRAAPVEALQHEFRAGLARILGPDQLAEWDLLLEELPGALHVHH
jgi:hypothetical protein